MRPIALASCFVLFACGGEVVDDGGGGSGTADAGSVAPDAGQAIADTGSEVADSGVTPAEDAGSEPADAGEMTPDDAGAPPPPSDSGPTPGRPDAGQGGGGGTCIQAMECSLRCEGEEACMNRCLAGVAPEHRQVTQAMFDCAQRNNCADPNCMMMRCQEEAQACGRAGGGGGGPPPGGADGGRPPNPGGDDGGRPPNPGGGESSCSEFLRCATSCDPNDQQCGPACMNTVRPQSMNVMNALLMCMSNSQCQDFDCARTSCPDQMTACAADQN